MPTIIRTCSLLLTALLLGGSATARAAEVYAVGSTVAGFTAKDQHEKAFTFAPGPKFLMVSFDMSTGKKANAKLDQLGNLFLDEKKAAYVANIYGMPGIGRTFALPKMRKYKHRIILGDAAGLLDAFPKQEDRVTVLQLDPAAKITSIRFWNPEKEALTTFLDQPAAQKP